MSEDLLPLLAALVATASVNPSLVPGGAGEREVAGVVAAWARDAGLEVEVLEATTGRPSVLVRGPGRGGGPALLLCGHLDTVGVEGMREPFAARRDGDRLQGRGAYDMKGGLAAALVACAEAARLGLAGDVVVAAVADEEHASLGVQEALARLGDGGRARPAAAVVTEPTELAVAVAHKGFAWSEVVVEGRAAHGSRPHLGVDAIVKAGPVLTALGALDARLGERPHPLLGRASVHVSRIAGGGELSSYPASCVVDVERRTLPGETGTDVEAELAAVLGACRAADPALVVASRTTLVREPFAVDSSAGVVRAVRDAATAALGAPPAVGGVSYWADSAFLAAAGIPTVLFGPAGTGAHADEESVSVSSCAAVARTLVETARRVCA